VIDLGDTTLVDAMAGEHRLRRQAVREAQDAELWSRRAEMAESRGLGEMASGARERADRHSRMVQVLLARATEIRSEIEQMRAILEIARGVGRAPPGDAGLDARFAKLEVEQEIERIRAAIAARRTDDDQAVARPIEDAMKEEAS